MLSGRAAEEIIYNQMSNKSTQLSDLIYDKAWNLASLIHAKSNAYYEPFKKDQFSRNYSQSSLYVIDNLTSSLITTT